MVTAANGIGTYRTYRHVALQRGENGPRRSVLAIERSHDAITICEFLTSPLCRNLMQKYVLLEYAGGTRTAIIGVKEGYTR